jgi:hypothetical protein
MMFNKIKNFKTHCTKLAASSIIATSILLNGGLAHAAVLQDVQSSSDYAKDSIIALAEKNIISGDEHGNFHPRKTVTRAEMTKMIVNALEIDTTSVPDTPTFTDIPQAHWSYPYVEAAYREGIVKGISEEVFGKNEECTREQMTLMFVRSLGLSNEIVKAFPHIHELSDKDMVADWAKGAVEFSLASGLMQGTDSTIFEPKGHAPREQVAVVTHRLINNKETILEFAKEISETVKHPELYEALMVSEDYRGEFDMNAFMSIKGTTPEETMTLTFTGTGAVNGTDRQIK